MLSRQRLELDGKGLERHYMESGLRHWDRVAEQSPSSPLGFRKAMNVPSFHGAVEVVLLNEKCREG